MIGRMARIFSQVGSACLIVSGTIIVISVFLRKFLATQIPDTNDFSRLLMGIAIMCGIALACRSGEQIKMDSLWSIVNQRGKIIIDIIANIIGTLAMACLTWMLVERIVATYQSKETTFDVLVPIWWFYTPVGIAAIAATIFSAYRLWLLSRKGAERHYEDFTT